MELFGIQRTSQYEAVLGLLEDVYRAAGPYKYSGPEHESKRDALILNFAKVVSDCRAILLLSRHHLYIQAGILVRSAIDACHLMVHLGFAENPPQILTDWVAGRGVKHWPLIRAVSRQTGGRLDLGAYEQLRRGLDDFVHGNYEGVRLYPVQLAHAEMDDPVACGLALWSPLLNVFLYSCLMVVPLISPDFTRGAQAYMSQIAALGPPPTE